MSIQVKVLGNCSAEEDWNGFLTRKKLAASLQWNILPEES